MWFSRSYAARYINGHDHNAQHLNDGSLVEYLVVGAGAPVNPSRAHSRDVPDGSLKFYWARSADERAACKSDPDCRFDTTINDGSFAYITFQDTSLAKVELVTHHGEVVYRLTKPNPRSNEAAVGYDHTEQSADRKVYVPYKSAHLDWIEAVPGVCTDSTGTVTGHSNSTLCLKADTANTWADPQPGRCVDHRGRVRVFERTCESCKTAAACADASDSTGTVSSDLAGAAAVLATITLIVGLIVCKKLRPGSSSTSASNVEEGIYAENSKYSGQPGDSAL